VEVGEQFTLRVVAKYADACNVSGSPETIKRKMNILKEHCKSVGRDYDSILKTSLNHVVFIDGEDRDITNHEPKSILDPNSTAEEVKRIQTSESLLRHEEKVKKAQAIYGSTEEIFKQRSMHQEAGIQYVIVNFEPSREANALEIFADKIIERT
jgi:alkanesulfonate monooxygenase SsuD/methylene tetrahydromethanopterin reductase-like flavin-dependent oxidoreductase (luciferase family)